MSRSFGHAVPRSRKLRGITSLAAVGTALLMLSGCGLLSGSQGSDSIAGGNGDVEKSTVKFVGLPTLDRAVVHLAQDKGFFAEEGLKVDVADVSSGGDSVQKLISGEADFSGGSYTPYLQAQAKNVADLKIVDEVLVSKPNLQPVMIAPNSRLQRAEDIQGKKVAITAPGTISEIAAKSVLRDRGIDFSRTQWVPMGFNDMPAALQRGDVDAAVMMEPYTTQAARTFGAKTIFDIYSGATENFPVAGIATTADFAQKNPKTVQAFQRAIQKAKNASQDHKEVVDVLPKHTKVPPDIAPLIELGQTPMTTEKSRLQRVATLMYSFQLTPEEVDVAHMVLPPPPPKSGK